MNPVKLIPPSIPKDVKVVLESSTLPVIPRVESKLHKFVPRSLSDSNTVYIPEKMQKELAAKQPPEKHIDFFG